MSRVILLLADGLRFAAAAECMGFMAALIEDGQGCLYKVTSALPSLSRPLYECLLTGRTPLESGIYHNGVCRLSQGESIFSAARAAGLTTAAAAYSWVSELYNRAPFDGCRDRMVHDPELNIQHGIFYPWDHYPDEAVLLDAEYLRQSCSPDFLFIHTMNIDDTGHHFGGSSPEYRNQVRRLDQYLSGLLPQWLADGWQVLITADHGMNDDCSHGGSLRCEREVPLFVLGDRFAKNQCASVRQTQICGLCADLLGLAHHFKTVHGVINV